MLFKEHNAAAQTPPTNGRGHKCIALVRSFCSRLLCILEPLNDVLTRLENVGLGASFNASDVEICSSQSCRFPVLTGRPGG